MSNELSGLELRKALALALGWRWFDGYWHTPQCRCGVDESAQDECLCPEPSICPEELPAFESDPAISEQTLDAECQKRGWRYGLSMDSTRGEGHHAYCAIDPLETFAGSIAYAFGKDESEARARCLLKALQSIGGEQGNCEHEWITRRMGGSPSEASSDVRVTNCVKCGAERQVD